MPISVSSTITNSKKYYICSYFFGTVIAEKTTHRNVGREVKITLVKAHKGKINILFIYLLYYFYYVFI